MLCIGMLSSKLDGKIGTSQKAGKIVHLAVHGEEPEFDS